MSIVYSKVMNIFSTKKILLKLIFESNAAQFVKLRGLKRQHNILSNDTWKNDKWYNNTNRTGTAL